MKRLSLLTLLALFVTTLTQQGGARAQAQDTKPDNWSQVPTVTSAWTHITTGSTNGFELKDDYYYVSKDSFKDTDIVLVGSGKKEVPTLSLERDKM